MPHLFNNQTIPLEVGSGGQAGWRFFKDLRKILNYTGRWTNTGDDGAVLKLGQEYLVMTTDGFIIDPLFFPGGDIGKIAVCGTINDLAVMGAKPLGLSLSFIIEEGFPSRELKKILKSITKMMAMKNISLMASKTELNK